MIESIFKSFDLSNVTENHQGPLFWNLVSKKAQLYIDIHRFNFTYILATFWTKIMKFCELSRFAAKKKSWNSRTFYINNKSSS